MGVKYNWNYPINTELCKTCKYRHAISAVGEETYAYYCNYMYITGHHKPTLETDGGDVCGCYEKETKK